MSTRSNSAASFRPNRSGPHPRLEGHPLHRILADLIDGEAPSDWGAAAAPDRFDGRALNNEPAAL